MVENNQIVRKLIKSVSIPSKKSYSYIWITLSMLDDEERNKLVNLRLRDEPKKSLLMLAIEATPETKSDKNTQKDIITFLIQSSANLDYIDSNNKKAADYAKEKKLILEEFPEKNPIPTKKPNTAFNSIFLSQHSYNKIA